MMTAAHKGMSSGLSKSFVAVLSSAATLIIIGAFFTSPYSPTAAIARASFPTLNAHSRPKCPVLLYNKQIKTGSTLIANVIYRTTEAYGCRNSGCHMHQSLMTGNVTHVGAIAGMTLTCHAREYNPELVRSLRLTHGNNFIYVASVREPISWFKSTACFFYSQHVEKVISWTDESFKKAVDWLLGRRYYSYEKFLFHSLGLPMNASKRQMFDKLLGFDVLIDNSYIKEGIEELGLILGWKMLEPTQSKNPTYRGSLYNTYRVEEIKQITKNIAALYIQATEVREARNRRPKFAREEAPLVSNLSARVESEGARFQRRR